MAERCRKHRASNRAGPSLVQALETRVAATRFAQEIAMSSHQGSGDRTRIRHVDQLVAHHAKGERPADQWVVGTEHEKFALLGPSFQPAHYKGHGGIEQLLAGLADCCGWAPEVDAGALIALSSPEEGSVALEPGGQFEMSGRPLATVHDTKAELDRHLAELEKLSQRFDVRWMWRGYQPVHALDSIDWMPKRRYTIMRAYLPTRGRHAREMMQGTCTVQANLDYGSEQDMGLKLRAAMGVSSIVTTLFANSPLRLGRPSGFNSYRAQIWTDVDNDRSGLLPFFFTGNGPTYEEYARWALKVPLFFIMRDGEYLSCAGLPFETFWREGFKGHEATMEDWELHLSTLFPDVRMKTYFEVRSADCVPPTHVPALPALWKGLLYDPVALDAAWDLTKSWSFAERQTHRTEVCRRGLQTATPKGFETLALAKELVDMARFGLDRLAKRDGHPTESIYLDPLDRIVASGQNLADETLAWFNAASRSEAEILDHLSETRPPS